MPCDAKPGGGLPALRDPQPNDYRPPERAAASLITP